MKRLYVDMDGTLAVFNNQIESEEVLFQKGYYRNLPGQQNVIDAVKEILKDDRVEVFILSAVLPSPYAEKEKNEWLNENLPEVDSTHRLFVPCGEDKGKYIGHVLGKDDLLLDDYSKNLHSWCPPGRAVKLMNHINGRFGTWKGNSVSMDLPPEVIAGRLCAALGLENREFSSYQTIKSQFVGTFELAIGYNEHELPIKGFPYCCWIRDNTGYQIGVLCQTERDALLSFYQKLTEVERSQPVCLRPSQEKTEQAPEERLSIQEQLAAIRRQREESDIKNRNSGDRSER